MSGTPTFYFLGVPDSCFQNPSEIPDMNSTDRITVYHIGHRITAIWLWTRNVKNRREVEKIQPVNQDGAMLTAAINDSLYFFEKLVIITYIRSLLISRRQEAKLPAIMNVQPPTFHIFTVYFF